MRSVPVHDFHYCEGTMSTATDIANRIQRGLDFAPASNNALEDIPLLKSGLMRAEWERIISALLAYDSPPYVSRSEWIKCADRMPPNSTYVLGYQERTGNIAVGMATERDDGMMWMFGASMGHESKFPHLKFTHWMSLPQGPHDISSLPVAARDKDAG